MIFHKFTDCLFILLCVCLNHTFFEIQFIIYINTISSFLNSSINPHIIIFIILLCFIKLIKLRSDIINILIILFLLEFIINILIMVLILIMIWFGLIINILQYLIWLLCFHEYCFTFLWIVFIRVILLCYSEILSFDLSLSSSRLQFKIVLWVNSLITYTIVCLYLNIELIWYEWLFCWLSDLIIYWSTFIYLINKSNSQIININ